MNHLDGAAMSVAQAARPAGTTAATTAAIAPAMTAHSAAAAQEQQLLTEAAVKFEAFFVAQMMKQMRQATAVLADPDSPLRDEANQAPLAMADHAVADSLAGQRAFGIADVLVRQMGSQIGHAEAVAHASPPNTTRAAARRNAT